MTPLQILQDIVTIARVIHAQVELTRTNHAKLKTLTHTMQLLVAALEGLSDLPDNQQFIQSLTSFQMCMRDTKVTVEKIVNMGRAKRFFYAQANEGYINACKQRIVEFIPLLSLGLNAQQLMDRERDRRDDLADRQAFIAQKEQALREAQESAKIDRGERDAIILKQLASVRNRLDKQSLPISLPVSLILPEELIVNLYDIIFEQKLEESDFGSIYQGTWQDHPVTIKCFDHMATTQELTQLTREAQVMSRLHHESMTHFYGACLDQERPCLLTSVLEKGNLEINLTSLSLGERLTIAKNLARGLAYLHGQNIIHGDIRPKNVGINKHHEAKWTNFGLAKVRVAEIGTLPRVSYEAAWQAAIPTQNEEKTSENNELQKKVYENREEKSELNQEVNLEAGTAAWQAPESWQNRAELSIASDIYSFGMLLWTLVNGRLPYSNTTASNIICNVQRGERETISDDMPRECRTIIEACWSADAVDRPTAKQISLRLSEIDIRDFRASSPTGEEYYERGIAAEHAGNMIEAYEDYRRSSEKHYPKSLTSLGLFSLQGLGGQTVDKRKAENYLKSAADMGHARAMFNLGRMYEKGQTETNVPDYPKALFWYQEFLRKDPEDARAKEKIAALSVLVSSVDSGYMFKSKT